MTRSLDDYRLLGRSGLRVSPLALGTMTFGADWGWGAGPEEARQIFDAYVERGITHLIVGGGGPNYDNLRLLEQLVRWRDNRA